MIQVFFHIDYSFQMTTVKLLKAFLEKRNRKLLKLHWKKETKNCLNYSARNTNYKTSVYRSYTENLKTYVAKPPGNC